jgi:hypothetical protein
MSYESYEKNMGFANEPLSIAMNIALLCSPPMLSAEAGDGARTVIPIPGAPHHQADEASTEKSPLRLGNEQLDSIVAGHVITASILPPLPFPNPIPPSTGPTIPIEPDSPFTIDTR